MDAAKIIAVAVEAAKLASTLVSLVDQVRGTLGADDLATLEGQLEAVHARNLAGAAELDAALAEAEQR